MMTTSRRNFFLTVSAVCAGGATVSGCTTPLFRGQSPEQAEIVDQTITENNGVELVRDYALPTGTHYVKLESIGLVTGLERTGSDPPSSPGRERLLEEMKSHDVSKPESILASDATAMVHVRAFLPPGVRKGDQFDVEVRLPKRSDSESLEAGWLMASRLREAAVLGGAVRTGDVDALAVGKVYTLEMFDKNDAEDGIRVARILGGATANKARPLGLRILRSHRTIKTSSVVAAAINQRFHFYDGSSKKGVANPVSDTYIELALPSRYKNNIKRFMDVASRIAVDESAALRGRRMADLERRLHEPTTTSDAAMKLEAIGPDAVSVLMSGMNSADAEVRFYSAEALGYLDVAEAAPILGQVAAAERAFRWHALTALSTMDHVAAYDTLSSLLDQPSVETRYGAFRAMQTRNKRDPLIKGEVLGKSFAFHAISTSAEPLIHFSRVRRPEVVLFGREAEIQPPKFLFAGKKILLKAQPDGQVKVTRFAPGNGKDQSVMVSPVLSDIIRAIVQVGGGYREVFEGLKNAKEMGYLNARLAVDARPRLGRRFDRIEPSDGQPTDSDSPVRTATPVPDLYVSRLDTDDRQRPVDEPSYAEEQPEPTTWSRMKGWFGGK